MHFCLCSDLLQICWFIYLNCFIIFRNKMSNRKVHKISRLADSSAIAEREHSAANAASRGNLRRTRTRCTTAPPRAALTRLWWTDGPTTMTSNHIFISDLFNVMHTTYIYIYSVPFPSSPVPPRCRPHSLSPITSIYSVFYPKHTVLQLMKQ